MSRTDIREQFIIRPITLREAKEFVAQYHRHNNAPVSWKFGSGLGTEDQIVGVAMAGRPVSRALDTLFNIEITRVCTLEDKNANSRLYGSVCRASKALGYRTAYSYTLQTESGTSLRAAGFEIDDLLDARPTWSCPARHRIQKDLFGNDIRPPEAKIRWIRRLA